MSGVLLVS